MINTITLRKTAVTVAAGRGVRGETAPTSETKQKVEAAVLARHPGATIVRTETNRGSRTTIDGTELEVLVNKDFDAVDGRRARNRADRG